MTGEWYSDELDILELGEVAAQGFDRPGRIPGSIYAAERVRAGLLKSQPSYDKQSREYSSLFFLENTNVYDSDDEPVVALRDWEVRNVFSTD